MKICKGWLQALFPPTPRGFTARSRVLASLASLAQIGELARRLDIPHPRLHTRDFMYLRLAELNVVAVTENVNTFLLV